MLVDLKPRILKPTFGSAQIDRGHPFSFGLVGLWLMNSSGAEPNVVYSSIPSETVVSWTQSPFGLAAKFDGSASRFRWLFVSGPLQFNDNVIVFAIVSQATSTLENRLLYIGDSAETRGFNFSIYMKDSSGRLLFGTPIGTGLIGTSTTAVSSVNTWFAVMAASGTGQSVKYSRYTYSTRAYATETITGPATITSPASADSVFIGQEFGSNFFAGNLAYLGLWRRPRFSDAEFLSLATEPYAFLRPVPAVRYWSTPPAAAAAAGSVVSPRSLALLGVGS